jgi:hypothetical protein
MGTVLIRLTIARRGGKRNWAKVIVRGPRGTHHGAVSILPLLAPLFLLLEAWQLVMCERYVGIKQIARGGDPREMGPGEAVSFFWSAGLIAYGAWALALLAEPRARVFALCIIAATVIGYPIRRNCGLKWILVVLTCEGGVRIGFLSALSYLAWSRL